MKFRALSSLFVGLLVAAAVPALATPAGASFNQQQAGVWGEGLILDVAGEQVTFDLSNVELNDRALTGNLLTHEGPNGSGRSFNVDLVGNAVHAARDADCSVSPTGVSWLGGVLSNTGCFEVQGSVLADSSSAFTFVPDRVVTADLPGLGDVDVDDEVLADVLDGLTVASLVVVSPIRSTVEGDWSRVEATTSEYSAEVLIGVRTGRDPLIRLDVTVPEMRSVVTADGNATFVLDPMDVEVVVADDFAAWLVADGQTVPSEGDWCVAIPGLGETCGTSGHLETQRSLGWEQVIHRRVTSVLPKVTVFDALAGGLTVQLPTQHVWAVGVVPDVPVSIPGSTVHPVEGNDR